MVHDIQKQCRKCNQFVHDSGFLGTMCRLCQNAIANIRKRNYRDKFRREEVDKYIAISDRGRIRNRSGAIYLPKQNKRGYRRIEIHRKTYMVHRLVAVGFGLPRMEGQILVDHINEDKGDNRKSNLRWASPSENVLYSYASGRHRRAANVTVRKGDGGHFVTEDEEWKVVGDHGESISSYGRWKNRYGSIRMPHETDGSYARVSLNGKLESVHRLVLTAFCPTEGSEDLQVDHIDGDHTKS